MKNLLAPLCFLACIPVAFCQSPHIDSLERVYLTASTDTQRLALLDEMTDASYEVSLDTALVFGRAGVTLAQKTGDKYWIPKFYDILGRVHANMSQLDSARRYFDNAVTGFTAIGNKKGEASALFKIGWVLRHQGVYDKAMDVDIKALKLMEELDDKAGIASALGRISEDLTSQGRTKEALEYARRSVEICEQNNLQDQLPYAWRNAGDVCIAMGNSQEAFDYYDKALSFILARKDSKSDIADMSNARGNALKRLGKYDEAIEDYQLCLKLSEEMNYHGGISTALANLGEINLLRGNYAAALPYQLRTVELQEGGGDVMNLTENYRHVSTIYEKLGDYQNALLYERKARHMRDSTASIQSNLAVSELRTEYETEKKEATIATQHAQLGQQRKMQWLYIGIAALLGISAISFYRNAVARKKSNTLLATKNAENELLLKEIHHRVKNNLEVVSSLLALQSAQISDQGIKDAMLEGQNRVQSIGIVHQKLYQGTNLAAVEMKDYFVNLSESILDSFGADDRVTIECAMNNLELDIDTAVPLGLITNEILTNALKYAFPDGRAGKIEIRLERKDENTLQLKIADDGIGKSGMTQGTGFGTQLVSLLTRQLSGTMREEVKDGTAIYFDFAVKKAA